ncbi:MAG TPA: hypothetical protein VKY80_03780 [Croceibacterium sp.]|nr:hypothetical protein [Croceibacterium sp.]
MAIAASSPPITIVVLPVHYAVNTVIAVRIDGNLFVNDERLDPAGSVPMKRHRERTALNNRASHAT